MEGMTQRLSLAAIFVLAIAAQAQTDPRAQMISPTPGSILPVGAVTFTWSPAAGGGDYFLTVESAPGVHDIFNAVVTVTDVTLGPGCNTPTTIDPTTHCIPPNAGTIYVTLWTRIKGNYLTPFQYTFHNNAFFVSQLYRDLWNLTPDSAGVANWVSQITAGTVTRAQVAEAFFNDARFYPNASYIAKMFLGPLQRDPDFATWSSMFAQMQSGSTRAQMLASIMSRQEYQAVYGSLTNLDFVNALYQNILGRAPDTAGLNYWLLVLKFGVPRSAVIDGFLTSPEYEARSMNRVKANLMYFAFLRRTGEAPGLNYWTVVLNFGVQPVLAIQGFITSPEYLSRF